MRCKITALVLLLSLQALTAQQQDPVINKIIKEASENCQVMDHLDHLTNRIGPRLTSSDRLIRACEWAVAKFQSFGLEAKMEKWGEYEVGFNRGPWRGSMVSPRYMQLTFGTNAWTPGTKGKTTGSVVMAPVNEEELAAMEGGLAGKWVLEPGRRKIKREWRKRLGEIYKKAGVLGVIRSTGGSLVRTGGRGRIKWEDIPTTVSINLVKDQYEGIVADLKKGEDVVLEFDIRNYFRRGPVPVYNVIAELKGSEKPDEYVVVGGHIDSWDGATGTTDNGTGTTSTLEAARLLATAGARPERTIRFMLWSGEEQGLLGSRAWCKAHQDELERISGVFVHDMGTNYVSGIRVTEEQYADFEKIVAPVLNLSADMPFKLGKTKGLGGGGSDHASFLAMGVPGFFWNQSGRAKYGYGWHTQNDTFDIAIPEYQQHTATVVAIVAYGVANLPHKLSRKNLRSARGSIPTARSLGVNLEGKSLKVTEVTDGSVASRSGIKTGDVLISLDGVKLKDRFALRGAIRAGDPKKKLVLKRGAEMITLEVKWKANRRRSSRDGD